MISNPLPLISICMPVLNAQPFLAERLASIFAQTYVHWELIIVDGFSDDGSWEFLQAHTGRPGVRLSQAPREGIYAAINRTLEQAQGDWLYIATADDTMVPQCLEVLLGLVREEEPPCIAQCGLTLIDEDSEPIPEALQWPANTEWQPVFGEQFKEAHERKAPFDGAAVMLFGTVITSLTQALFPREAFVKYGGFPTGMGSAGDMAWEGLLGFFYDVRYTPVRLATWRFHDAQATAGNAPGYYDRNVAIGAWILDKLKKHSPQKWQGARRSRLAGYTRFAQIRNNHAARNTIRRRLEAGLRLMVSCPKFYLSYLLAKGPRKNGSADPVTISRLKAVEKFIGGHVGEMLIARTPPRPLPPTDKVMLE